MNVAYDERGLIEAAIAARARAYAPYSDFKVGAALMLRSGVIATGVNVENVSYGLTVCAERNAVAAAVLAGAVPGDVLCVVVAAASDQPVAPCGACRQVLVEFAAESAPVLLHNLLSGITERHMLSALLPRAFVKARL